jgi:hypothetical protein
VDDREILSVEALNFRLKMGFDLGLAVEGRSLCEPSVGWGESDRGASALDELAPFGPEAGDLDGGLDSDALLIARARLRRPLRPPVRVT